MQTLKQDKGFSYNEVRAVSNHCYHISCVKLFFKASKVAHFLPQGSAQME